MSRHDQLPWHVSLVYNKIVYMNVMAETLRAFAYLFPPSFIVQLLTMVMKHDYIGGTDLLAVRRHTQPKVQYTIAALMGNTSRVIQMLKNSITLITFTMLKDGYTCRHIFSKTRSNRFRMLHNIKDKTGDEINQQINTSEAVIITGKPKQIKC